jgi:hypothetical protein
MCKAGEEGYICYTSFQVPAISNGSRGRV